MPSLPSSSFLSTSSPRKPSGSGGIGGPAQFNFSDFVVSPVAFGQTSLQQSQQQSANNQQFRPSPFPHNQSSSSGLGMDLGLPYRD